MKPTPAKPNNSPVVDRIECLDEIHAHWRRLRVLTEMLEHCDEFHGSAIVEARFFGELGGMFSRELKGMHTCLRKLGELSGR